MVGSKKGKQVQICSYYPPEMADRLKALAERTRVPLATYLREAAEDLLSKYQDMLQKSPPKPPGSKSRR
jgi:predicted DNA-binding protein